MGDLILELAFWIIKAIFKELGKPAQAPEARTKEVAGDWKGGQTARLSPGMKDGSAAQRPELKGKAWDEPEQARAVQSKVSVLEAKNVEVWAEHRKRQEAIEAEHKAKAPKV